MIFYGVDAYFPCQKGGPRKILRPERGALKIFRAKFFFASGPPLQVFVNGPVTFIIV